MRDSPFRGSAGKGKMKRRSAIVLLIGFLAVPFNQGFCQTNLQLTGAAANDERAIRITWASTSNEVYQIQYANALATNVDGTTAWQLLYDEYPSQGTNTFWLDTGNYDLLPPVLHPKYASMRFYRILDEGPDTTSDEPTVSILTPTNGTVVSGELTINVLAGTDQPFISGTKLYVDGQEMQMADDATNYSAGSTNYETDTYSINTCEWGNGPHTLFATARCTSAPEGAHNVPYALIGHAASAFVPITFSNLVTRISFSQYFFDPAAGQTQQVSAVFAANCDWTLNITDLASNIVKTATGSGTSMVFNWDGTGTGGTNLSAGIYYYYITAQTNGLAPKGLSGDGSGGNPPAPAYTSASELWAVAPDSENVLPLAIYPPGFDTNGFLIFSASPADVETLTEFLSLDAGSTAPMADTGGTIVPDFSGPSPQPAPAAPQRPPTNPVRGVSGTFGIAYQTYAANGSAGYTPPFPDNGLHINQKVQMENRSASNPINYEPVKESKTMANNFIKWMKRGGWSLGFQKVDDQLNISDLRGSGTPFNQVNFGLLLLHGTYGTSLDYTANGCMQMYFPITAGGSSQYLRMSEMNFGGSGSNGLKWITLWACFSLQADDWQNMQMAGIKPYNNNLHLILGAHNIIYSDSHLLGYWAKYMTVGQTANNPMSIRAAWYSAARKAYAGQGFSGNITFAVAGDDACRNDTLQNNSAPSGTPYYDSIQVFP